MTRALAESAPAEGRGAPAAGAQVMRHVVILSSGRSGSNRLLDLFDQHPDTNCRNELNADDPAFRQLEERIEDGDLSEDFTASWGRIVAQAARHKGARDRYDTLAHKSYLRAGTGRLWTAAARRGKLRGSLLGHGRRTDFPIAGWALRREAAPRIVPVIKVSGPRELFVATHADMPGQVIVHNIRHPASFLKSWYNRYVQVKFGSDEAAYESVLARHARSRAEAGMPPSPGPFSRRNLFLAQAQWWRLQNEAVYEAFRGTPRYLLVTYDEVSDDPVAQARRLFAFAQLEMDRETETRVQGMKRHLFHGGHSTRLDDVMIGEVVAEAAGDSPLWPFVERGRERETAGSGG